MVEVSVLIPCNIGEIRVLNSVKSIYDPRVKMEILVGLNGQDSSLKKLLKNLPIKDLEVFELSTECNTSSILNFLVHRSKGKYIARMDADDISLPNRIVHQISVMNRNENIAVLCGNSFLSSGEIMKSSLSNFISCKDVLKSNPIIHPTVMFRREVFDSLEKELKYNSWWNRSQDYELWSRLVRVHVFYYDREPVLIYNANFNFKNFTSQHFYFSIAKIKNLFWHIRFARNCGCKKTEVLREILTLYRLLTVYIKVLFKNV